MDDSFLEQYYEQIVLPLNAKAISFTTIKWKDHGKVGPDTWAHYFEAETKGDTSDIQLREVERAKIECARRHFDKISDNTVKYSAVSSYAELMTAVQK